MENEKDNAVWDIVPPTLEANLLEEALYVKRPKTLTDFASSGKAIDTDDGSNTQVFTPKFAVDEMLGWLGEDNPNYWGEWGDDNAMLEPAVGAGAFYCEYLRRRFAWAKEHFAKAELPLAALRALATMHAYENDLRTLRTARDNAYGTTLIFLEQNGLQVPPESGYDKTLKSMLAANMMWARWRTDEDFTRFYESGQPTLWGARERVAWENPEIQGGPLKPTRYPKWDISPKEAKLKWEPVERNPERREEPVERDEKEHQKRQKPL